MSLRFGANEISNVMSSGDQAIAVMNGDVRVWPSTSYVMTVIDYVESETAQRVNIPPWAVDVFIAAWGGGGGGGSGYGANDVSGNGGESGRLITWSASKAGKPVPSYIDAVVGKGADRVHSEVTKGLMGGTTTINAPFSSIMLPLQASGGEGGRANNGGTIKGADAPNIYLPDGTLVPGGAGGPTTLAGRVGAPGEAPGGGGAGGDGGLFGAFWSGGPGGHGRVIVYAVNYGLTISPMFLDWINSR